jgi:hypothetical protein
MLRRTLLAPVNAWSFAGGVWNGLSAAILSAAKKGYTFAMASRYPRMGIARDPELQRALANTRPLLSRKETRSAAAQVRALALRGAETLMQQAGPAGELRQRLSKKYDVIPAHVDPRTIGAPQGAVDPEDPTPGSDALQWVRGG